MRGWLVPGFCPAMTMSSASWMSCRLTDPLPMPMLSASATDVDSWHMFEQSGRLLVPNARANSWRAERRLVGRPPARVERRLTRLVEAAQGGGDEVDRVVHEIGS